MKEYCNKDGEMVAIVRNCYEPRKNTGKVFYGISKTVPDKAMSIRELLTRFAHGQELEGRVNPSYEDEESPNMGVDLRTMDLVELQEMKMEYERKFKEAHAEQKRRKAEEKAAELEKAKAEEQAKLDALASNTPTEKNKGTDV